MYMNMTWLVLRSSSCNKERAGGPRLLRRTQRRTLGKFYLWNNPGRRRREVLRTPLLLAAKRVTMMTLTSPKGRPQPPQRCAATAMQRSSTHQASFLWKTLRPLGRTWRVARCHIEAHVLNEDAYMAGWIMDSSRRLKKSRQTGTRRSRIRQGRCCPTFGHVHTKAFMYTSAHIRA